MTVLLCNGRPAEAAVLATALVNYGHFSSMLARAGAVQGLDLHLQRLREATSALFGCELDEAAVRSDLRKAVALLDGDAWLRLSVVAADFDLRRAAAPLVPIRLVAATPAVPTPSQGLHVRSVGWLRDSPEFKHVGTFPLLRQRRLAVAAGFDDALLLDPQHRVVEGTLWNLGLWDGERVLWPQGPALRGTRERLLQAGLDALGVAQIRRPVVLEELGPTWAGFTCNARGQQPLRRVDQRDLAVAPKLSALLERALATQPWQPL